MGDSSKHQCLFLNLTPFSSLFTFRTFLAVNASSGRATVESDDISYDHFTLQPALSRMMLLGFWST